MTIFNEGVVRNDVDKPLVFVSVSLMKGSTKDTSDLNERNSVSHYWNFGLIFFLFMVSFFSSFGMTPSSECIAYEYWCEFLSALNPRGVWVAVDLLRILIPRRSKCVITCLLSLGTFQMLGEIFHLHIYRGGQLDLPKDCAPHFFIVSLLICDIVAGRHFNWREDMSMPEKNCCIVAEGVFFLQICRNGFLNFFFNPYTFQFAKSTYFERSKSTTGGIFHFPHQTMLDYQMNGQLFLLKLLFLKWQCIFMWALSVL